MRHKKEEEKEYLLGDGGGEHLDVVLGSGNGITDSSDHISLSLLDKGSLISTLSNELAHNLIKGRDTTCFSSKGSILVSLCSCLVVDVGDEGIHVSGSLVLVSSLVVLAEPLEGGVSSDLELPTLLLVGITINLGNNNVVLTSEGIGNDLVVRGETLAVSAPLFNY